MPIAGSDLPAVVSYRFWSQPLGAPASLSGQQLVVNGRAFSVVGVLADDFQGPGALYAPDMWLPLEQMNVLNVPEARSKEPWLTLFGRLRDTASLAQARTELAAAAAAFSNGTPDQRRSGVFYPMKDGHPDLREIRKAAWLALAVVGVVLLIACFNVASLLMARAAERQKEIAGYIAGRLLARGLFGVSPADPISFAATVFIELAVGMLACALPAYRATRVDPLVALRQDG
jgi:hypothetical protein